MPHRSLVLIILQGVMCLLMACIPDRREESSTSPDTTATPLATETRLDFVIKAGVRAGAINGTTSESALSDIYGHRYVRPTVASIGEGETAPATLIYPDSPDELVVYWEDASHSTVAYIEVRRPDSRWVTSQGIRVGTSLEELNRINGKPFTFYGFEWDYAGRIADWQSGSIPVDIGGDLAQPDSLGPGVLAGDAKFNSGSVEALANNPKLGVLRVEL